MNIKNKIQTIQKWSLTRKLVTATTIVLILTVLFLICLFFSYCSITSISKNTIEQLQDGNDVITTSIDAVYEGTDYHFTVFANQTIGNNISENPGDIPSYEFTHLSSFISVSGWAILRGEPIDSQNVSVLLLRKSTDTYYKMHTFAISRPDITEYFSSDNCNYNACGFYASALRIFLPRDTYTVCLLYFNNGHNYLVKTNMMFDTF